MTREQQPNAGEIVLNTSDSTPRMRAVSRAFVGLCLALLLAPLLLMGAWSQNTASGEKRELAPWPQLVAEDGAPNTGYLGELGAWFEDRFAFRSTLIEFDASWREALLKTSATQNVVVGTEGWLYYRGDLPDYQRTALLSDRTLHNIAHNLALMQEHVEGLGKHFCVTIAPNKATLYPNHLPYYVRAGEGPSNLEQLEPLLAQEGVNYVSLTDVLRAQEGELYLARDSHWSNAGAQVGYRALVEALGRTPLSFDGATQAQEHVGDLEGMLHPSNPRAEQDSLYLSAQQFSYQDCPEDVEQPLINTKSTAPEATGTLLAYRDSFGNALLPYLATTYTQATFTKLVPYDMGASALESAEDVLVERVERHLSAFATNPPYMPAPPRGAMQVSGKEASATSIQLAVKGPYLVVEGELDPAHAPGDGVYVALRMADGSLVAFEPFYVSAEVAEGAVDAAGAQDADNGSLASDFGYRAYVPLEVVEGLDEAMACVVVRADGGAYVQVAQGSLELAA